MYYQNYEDYMREVLGYPISDPRIYEPYNYKMNQTYDYKNQNTYPNVNQYQTNLADNSVKHYEASLSDEEVRSFYPEIYNLVYPMVCRVCDTNTEPITKELIEKMTDEVYSVVDASEMQARPQRKLTPIDDSKVPKPLTSSNNANTIKQASSVNAKAVNTTRETRQYNSTLRDLIKILLLQRLFRRRPINNVPMPPPFPGGPGYGRTPYPGVY